MSFKDLTARAVAALKGQSADTEKTATPTKTPEPAGKDAPAKAKPS